MLPSFRSLSEPLIQRLSQLIYRCLEDLGSTKAALYLKDPATGAFELVSHYGWPRTLPPPERIAPQDPVLVLVARERRSLAVNDPRGYQELKPFGQGAANVPRFYLSPIYDRGDWKALLIQRDPSKGGAYDPERQDPLAQTICTEIVLALNAFPVPTAQAEPVREAPAVEEVPALRVPAPPSGAMVQVEAPAHPHSLAEVEAVIPEQQTFFWEAASLLCQMVPSAAVALWLNDAVDTKPLLVYSRMPLSAGLGQQVIQQFLGQLPGVRAEALRMLNRSEWPERDPLSGHFATLLPVLLEEEAGGENLLMLFRLEDRPFSMHEQDLVRQVSRMLGFYLQEAGLHERYHQAFLSVSHRILASAEGRIPSLKTHSINTAELSRDLARKVDLPTAGVEAVSISAILHDVGTLLLDYRVLDKPRLTAEELEKVRQHPLLASTFLKDLYFPFDVLHIIRHHHEHWNGGGYPDGLKGEDIPMGSRIIHLVEAYEMMISETPYRPAKTPAQAEAELERLAGSQFDPLLVAQFIQILKTRH
jgi:HD-GYP domain-containing protein (c-di-GMP phosphodiesterase class II)